MKADKKQALKKKASAHIVKKREEHKASWMKVEKDHDPILEPAAPPPDKPVSSPAQEAGHEKHPPSSPGHKPAAPDEAPHEEVPPKPPPSPPHSRTPSPPHERRSKLAQSMQVDDHEKTKKRSQLAQSVQAHPTFQRSKSMMQPRWLLRLMHWASTPDRNLTLMIETGRSSVRSSMRRASQDAVYALEDHQQKMLTDAFHLMDLTGNGEIERADLEEAVTHKRGPPRFAP